MKTFWNIDINKKIATFNDESIVFSFEFEIVFDEYLEINQKNIIENNKKIDLLKMSTYMRSMGHEISLVHFAEKLKFDGETDAEGIKMYRLEDDIYVDEFGTICILNEMGFEDTEFMCDINVNDIENTPVNLAKLVITMDEDEEDEESEVIEYMTFDRLKELL